MAKSILDKGETEPVKGFRSKAGKEFTAALKLDAEGKVTFSFPDPESLGFCPACGLPVRRRGKVWRCDAPLQDGKATCPFVIFGEMSGRTLTDDDVVQVLTSGHTGILEGFHDAEDRPYHALLRWSGQKVLVDRKDPREEAPSPGPCPRCGKPVTFRASAWNCAECTFRVPATVAGREIRGDEVADLLRARRTKRLHGFRQSGGAVFKAALLLDGDLRVQLDYSRPDDEAPEPVPANAAFGRRVDCPGCVSRASVDPGYLLAGREAWGCSRWKEGCRFRVPFTPEGIPLTDEDAIRLFGKARSTKKIQGRRIVLDSEAENGWRVE